MATVTKTFTEQQSSNKSTWTLSLTGNNVTANSSTISLPLTLKAKYVGASKGYADMTSGMDAYCGSYHFGDYDFVKAYGAWASSSEKSFTITNSIQTSSLFSSTRNKTVKTVSVTVKSWSGEGFVLASTNSSGSTYNYYMASSSISFGTICTITLDAPPTFTAPTMTKDTADYYAGLTTVSITVNDAVAQYGGDISSVTLNVNGQTKSISGQGTISMLLTNAGNNVIPTVTVTDSRGQTTTKPLAEINIQQYNIPSLSFDVYRVNSSGIKDDEGHFGLIQATVNYTSEATHLVEPTVEIDGTDVSDIAGASVTWYSASPFTSATEISDWGDVADGATVYGLIDANYASSNIFSESTSYQVTLIAEDGYNQSQPITQTLSTAFYTIDFQAGGKEIAFGAPANDTLSQTQQEIGLFKCGMESQFEQSATFEEQTQFEQLATFDGQSRFKLQGITSQHPSADVWRYAFDFVGEDDDTTQVGNIEGVQRTDGRRGISLGATRTVNGTEMYNWLTSYIADDGTRSWSTTDEVAFRKGIGLNSAFIVKRVVISQRSYTANQAYWWYNNNVTIPTISGYTPIGCLGCMCNSGGLIFATGVYPNDYHLYGCARNITSSNISIEVSAFILYVKTDLFEYRT